MRYTEAAGPACQALYNKPGRGIQAWRSARLARPQRSQKPSPGPRLRVWAVDLRRAAYKMRAMWYPPARGAGPTGGAALASLVALAALSALAASCSQPQSPPARTPERAAAVTIDADAFPPVPRPAGDAYDLPFFPGARYDQALTAPRDCLGHVVGDRLARPEAIVDCFRTWAEQSERVRIEPYARSYEGRELVRVIITSPANHERMDEILAGLDKLADPRGVPAGELQAAVENGPAVGWFGYSIHGDEVSGADASVGFGYHLIAAQDDELRALLEQVVVVIDPVMNPDGRARIVSLVEQSRSLVENLDYASMHRGRWPWGRGNHYLFDMNRDWLVGVAPETRGRWQGLLRYHPQLVVDAHEMGPHETYLFYPYADPVNPFIAPSLLTWQSVFASDQSRTFDRYGWGYYTREWADGWFPGYTDAWASLSGAVGMLYEQATRRGQSLMLPSGRRVSYRESVHAQAVSSMANLRTLAANRAAILADYLADKQRQVTPAAAPRSFALRLGAHPDRERALIATLLRQGVEVYRADAEFSARALETSMGERVRQARMPAGTLLIPETQPRGALVRAALAFDVRMPKSFLAKERAELERKGESKIYDVTAWNLGHSYDLDAAWIASPAVARTQVRELADIAAAPAAEAAAANDGAAYAWVIDGREDASVRFAALALERGLIVHLAERAFELEQRSFPRGSLVVRVGENQPDVAQAVAEVAAAAGVAPMALGTGRSSGEGPDLGGRHFTLLHRPRVAVLGNSPVSPSDFGHVWHHIDRELHLPMSLLDAQALRFSDLRRYNVLVIPPAWGSVAGLLGHAKGPLGAWLRAGGTLIALGNSAAAVASEDLGLSQARLRRDVLDQLPLYQAAVQRVLDAREIELDESAIWDGQPAPPAAPAANNAAGEGGQGGGGGPSGETPKGPGGGGPGSPELARDADAWMRRFAPQGAFLRALVDTDEWLTAGVRGAEMPVLVEGAHVLLAREGVRVPVRLAPAPRLRLSGLLWPEARERLALSAYATVERVGAGQVILFATPPSFRGATPGTARLLANAVTYGPSLGAWQPLRW
ncbi:hypothetical protein Hoch_5203 [Haliangium ochraceum DSM 14365]|uniref:Peptidase M14 domain-containing protein n=2 Tax=Haliangium ochraceum TaxID=80816 RepID=D0LWN9_HALO1|nr:hypothetical protein Hoch_5203 [Haliangium ochraceum DSM 14365]